MKKILISILLILTNQLFSNGWFFNNTNENLKVFKQGIAPFSDDSFLIPMKEKVKICNEMSFACYNKLTVSGNFQNSPLEIPILHALCGCNIENYEFTEMIKDGNKYLNYKT